jgi:hypothetical protein
MAKVIDRGQGKVSKNKEGERTSENDRSFTRMGLTHTPATVTLSM